MYLKMKNQKFWLTGLEEQVRIKKPKKKFLQSYPNHTRFLLEQPVYKTYNFENEFRFLFVYPNRSNRKETPDRNKQYIIKEKKEKKKSGPHECSS